MVVGRRRQAERRTGSPLDDTVQLVFAQSLRAAFGVTLRSAWCENMSGPSERTMESRAQEFGKYELHVTFSRRIWRRWRRCSCCFPGIFRGASSLASRSISSRIMVSRRFLWPCSPRRAFDASRISPGRRLRLRSSRVQADLARRDRRWDGILCRDDEFVPPIPKANDLLDIPALRGFTTWHRFVTPNCEPRRHHGIAARGFRMAR